MAIKHQFVSLVTDVGGPTYVQPTHWNSPLNAPQDTIYSMNVPSTYASLACPSTAGPTGFEFWANSADGFFRGQYDFAYVDNLRMHIGVGSMGNGPIDTGSAALRLQYMPSGFPGSWYSFDATGGSAPFVRLATAHNASLYLASHGLRQSPSMVVGAAVKALPQPVTFRLAVYGGGGSGVNLSQISIYGS